MPQPPSYIDDVSEGTVAAHALLPTTIFSDSLHAELAGVAERLLKLHQCEILRVQNGTLSSKRESRRVDEPIIADSTGYNNAACSTQALVLIESQRVLVAPSAEDSNASFQRANGALCADQRDAIAKMDSVSVSKADSSRPESVEKSHSSKPGSVEQLHARTSESSSTDKYELLQFWRETHWNRFTQSMTMSMMNASQVTSTATNLDSSKNLFARDGACFSNCMEALMMEPTSIYSVMMDTILVLCLLYDCVAVPLIVYELEEGVAEQIIEWISRICWTIAIPRTFLTAYMKDDGTTERHPHRVAKNYLAGWFFFDLIIVSLDWLTFGPGGIFRMLKTQRLVRLLKATRLVRLLKLPHFRFNLAQLNHTTSEIVTLSIGMVLNTLVFILLLHWLACLWYTLGTHYSRENGIDNTWLDALELEERAKFGARYTFSAHWAITHFNDGGTLVYAASDIERAFSILIMLFSYIWSAAFVSRITASFTRMQILSSQQSMEFSQLRTFLSNHKIHRELTFRVMTCARYFVEEKSRNQPEKEVALLQLLSEPLLVEVHYQMYRMALENHPFFKRFIYFELITMQVVCHKCVSTMDLILGDILFGSGQEPTQPNMYIINDGTLFYEKSDYASKIPKASKALRASLTQSVRANLSLEESTDYDSLEACKDGMWLCEATLWTRWIHKGVASAGTHCKILTINSQAFQKVLAEYRQSLYPRKYAEEFVDALNLASEEKPDEIDDLLRCIDLALLSCRTFPAMIGRTKSKGGSMLFDWFASTKLENSTSK